MKQADALENPDTRHWSIAIFTARESIDTLTGSIEAAVQACKDVDVTIDVLVNGNRRLADQAAQLKTRYTESRRGSEHRANRMLEFLVWFVPLGDKAHTWNEYVHRIWKASDNAFFIDGYAVVRQNALGAIEKGLHAHPVSLAATGVPTVGRSASRLRAEMARSGGIHGTCMP